MLCFSACLFKAPHLTKPSLLWLVSSHRPEQALPSIIPHQCCLCFCDHGHAGGAAEGSDCLVVTSQRHKSPVAIFFFFFIWAVFCSPWIINIGLWRNDPFWCPPPSEPGLLWLASSHRPEQTLPTVFPHQLCSCFCDLGHAVGAAESSDGAVVTSRRYGSPDLFV